MALPDRIVVDSKILTGKPVVRGTRISVELVVELLAAGGSHAQILASYPHLTRGGHPSLSRLRERASPRREGLSPQNCMRMLADENFPGRRWRR